MELKDLVGKHSLDAVDFSNEKVKEWGDEFVDCQVMRFRLDGNVYTAVENPDDGYRSSMRGLAVGNDDMKNIFTPVEVIGRHRVKGYYDQKDDILELIDTVSGEVVIEVGTENTDDYYPCFVASFNPKSITTNNG